MRVALVILHADADRGGAERYTLDLAADLAGRGHEVALLACSFGKEVPAGVRRVALAAGGVTRLGRYRHFLDSLDAHLGGAGSAGDSRARPYDVVHAMLPVRQCDLYHPHAGLAAEAMRGGHLKHRGPRRWLARLLNPLNRKRRAFAGVERRLLAGGEGPVVLCLSEYVKAAVRKHYPLAEGRLATLFNAVDLARFDPAARPGAGEEVRRRLGIAPGQVVALMIAQDFQRKGLREAIAAAARVNGAARVHDSAPIHPAARASPPAGPPLKLVVVGKERAAAWQAWARACGLAEVAFPGPTADPYAYYRAADLFVLPTRHDPCSLVVLEALAMGVPVVSTKFNGACEVMRDGVHGRVLDDPADVSALGDALRQMLDPQRRQRMRKACLELRPRLSQEQHLDALGQLYARIVAAQAAARTGACGARAGDGASPAACGFAPDRAGRRREAASG